MFLATYLLKNMKLGLDGVWGEVTDYGKQEQEKTFRQSIANEVQSNYLNEISLFHSIPVMDAQVKLFLNQIPKNGVVLDIGGCWGWHWRNINKDRPDITIVIIDLIRENLLHAKKILKDEIIKDKVFLVHGNACSLKFEDETFDGVWSVQTTQHIPDFEVVCKETFRVLKKKGVYWDYGLNNAALIRFVYKLFRKPYYLHNYIKGSFFLRRVNSGVIDTVTNVFNIKPSVQYSEVLFTPDLKLPIGGKENSILGKIDSLLIGNFNIWKLLARQCSLHVQKKN